MDNTAETADRVFDAYNAGDPEALRALYASTAKTRRPGCPTTAVSTSSWPPP